MYLVVTLTFKKLCKYRNGDLYKYSFHHVHWLDRVGWSGPDLSQLCVRLSIKIIMFPVERPGDSKDVTGDFFSIFFYFFP